MGFGRKAEAHQVLTTIFSSEPPLIASRSMPFKPALTIQGLFEFCVSFCRSTKSFGIGSERRARPTKVGELTIPRRSSHSPAVESHLPIHHVCHVASLAQAALLKKFGKSDVYDFLAEIGNRLSVWADFADNRPIVGTELGQRLGQSKGFHTRPDRA